MKCPKCQVDNPDTVKFCGECGTKITQPEDAQTSLTRTLETPAYALRRGALFADRYEIIEVLGRGGMGSVYRVEDIKAREEIAVKFIKPEIAANKKTIERFRKELTTARKIAHRNVCKMFDLGEYMGTYFITMEYVPGEDLRSLIKRVKLDTRTSIKIAKQICEGLAEAHRRGIVHRDLKPSNIMIDKEGNARIMDFGIARSLQADGITGAGMIVGTPEYMSPEQIEGKEVDQRSDNYSLGIILYEMLTGRIPFEGDSTFSIGLKHKYERPEDPRKINPHIPEGLGRLMLKCLEKDRENRYQNAGDLLSELIRIERGIPTTESGVPKRKSITSREITVKFNLKKLVIPVLLLVMLAVLISLSVIVIKRQPSGMPVLPEYTQFTFTGNAFYPAISPDGKFIAYVTSEAFDDKAVMVQDIITGQSLEVLQAKDCRYLRWTPDSTEISFWAVMKDSSTGIFSVPQLGGTPRRLGEEMFHAWSPDGLRLASCREDSKEIRITHKTTGDSISLPLKGSFPKVDAIDWSPNGKFLLVLVWYESHHFAIWTISTDGSEQHLVIEEDTDIFSPRWAPRGDAIYFFKYVPPVEEQLWKIPVSRNSGKPLKSPSHLIGGMEGIGLYFTITRDGKRLLYTREFGCTNLWLATMEGLGEGQTPKAEPLTSGTLFNLCPKISPDGSLVAFSRGRGRPINIFIMPIGGDVPRQVTFLDALNFSPVWSPDGDEIAFSSNQGGANSIWRVNVRDGNPNQFIMSRLDDVDISLAWSPGAHILFSSSGYRNISALDPDSEEVTSLLEDDTDLWMSNPVYSPDGMRVAVYGIRNSDAGLWLISLEDRSRVFLSEGHLIPLRWTADGKWIYVSERIQGTIKILKVALENGEASPVFILPFTLEMGDPVHHQVCMTPDALHFIIPATLKRSDVWMVQNFDPD